jgi:hypothetical protein
MWTSLEERRWWIVKQADYLMHMAAVVVKPFVIVTVKQVLDLQHIPQLENISEVMYSRQQ